jgi:hypothetical protein
MRVLPAMLVCGIAATGLVVAVPAAQPEPVKAQALPELDAVEAALAYAELEPPPPADRPPGERGPGEKGFGDKSFNDRRNDERHGDRPDRGERGPRGPGEMRPGYDGLDDGWKAVTKAWWEKLRTMPEAEREAKLQGLRDAPPMLLTPEQSDRIGGLASKRVDRLILIQRTAMQMVKNSSKLAEKLEKLPPAERVKLMHTELQAHITRTLARVYLTTEDAQRFAGAKEPGVRAQLLTKMNEIRAQIPDRVIERMPEPMRGEMRDKLAKQRAGADAEALERKLRDAIGFADFTFSPKRSTEERERMRGFLLGRVLGVRGMPEGQRPDGRKGGPDGDRPERPEGAPFGGPRGDGRGGPGPRGEGRGDGRGADGRGAEGPDGLPPEPPRQGGPNGLRGPEGSRPERKSADKPAR